MSATDGGNAAAFAHAAGTAAAAAATAAAAPGIPPPPPPPQPPPPSYFYGPAGTTGLPMYLAAMPPALGAFPPAATTMTMTEQQQQQQQSYFFLLAQQQHYQQQQLQQHYQQQQHLLQLQMQQQHLSHGWNPALLAPLYQMQQQQQQQQQQAPGTSFAPPFAALPSAAPPRPPPPPPPPVSLDALLFASAQAAASGDSQLATRLADAAVALSPNSAAALAALGAALHSASAPRLDLAIFYYGSALRICPGDGRVLNNLGAALAAAGAPAQAAEAYRASLAALCSSDSSTSISGSVPPSSSAPAPSSENDAERSSAAAIADVSANLGDLLRSMGPEISPSAPAAPAGAAAGAAAATGGGVLPPPSLAAAAAAATTAPAAVPPPPPPPPPPLLPPSSLPNASSSPSPPSLPSPPHPIADARSAYLGALAALPNHVRALTGLGDLCAEKGDAAGAAGFYGRAVAATGGGRSGGGAAAQGAPSSSSSVAAAAAASPAVPSPPPVLPLPLAPADPAASRARSGLCAALRDLGRLHEAEAAAREALSVAPGCPVALGVLTSALRARGDAAGAAEAAARAAAAAPPASSPEAFNALGNALREAGRPAEAVAAYSTCIRLQLSLGGVGGSGGRGTGCGVGVAPPLSAAAPAPSFPPPPYTAAAAEAAAAARLAVAYSNMAAALRACGRPEEATGAYEQVALLLPLDPAALSELGASLKDAGRHDEASVAYRRALGLLKARGLPGGAALAHLVHSLACVAEWRGDFSVLLKELERETRAALLASAAEPDPKKKLPPAVQPFHAMGYPFPPELSRDLSVAYAEHVERTALAFVEKEKTGEKEGKGKDAAAAKASPPPSPQTFPFRHPPPLPLAPNARLRVAFISSDFGNHPLSHLMAGVWHRLKNGGKIEAFLFATSPGDGSFWRARAETEAEHFVARPEFWADPSPVPLARAIAEAGCHVAINLNGYTRGARGEAFALRPAPVQASYLGFPGTLGAKRYVPWLITDSVTSPVEGEEECYAESLARMPHCYFVNDYRAAFGRGGEGTSTPAPSTPPRAPFRPADRPARLPRAPTRESLGLPPRPAVVFACANQLYKLDPSTLKNWCRILNSVPNSYLWLLRFPPAGEARVRAAAEEAGLLPQRGQPNPQERLVFTDVAPRELHVARCSLADVFLDTPRVNAHTTACDVLWSGVPIVTLPLKTMASRVCASLVTAAGLGKELVAKNEQEYFEIAVRLGLNVGGERARIRSFLLSTRSTTSALFDVGRWVRDFERLLWSLWVRHAAGEEPQSFELEKEEEVEVEKEEKKKKKKGAVETKKK